jgi:hypothetical protein
MAVARLFCRSARRSPIHPEITRIGRPAFSENGACRAGRNSRIAAFELDQSQRHGLGTASNVLDGYVYRPDLKHRAVHDRH